MYPAFREPEPRTDALEIELNPFGDTPAGAGPHAQCGEILERRRSDAAGLYGLDPLHCLACMAI